MSTQGRVTFTQSAPKAEAWVILLASVGVFLVALELTIVSVALPSLVADLGVRDDPAVTWVFSAYNLTVASLLLVFGWLADRLGRRRLFVFGLIFFAAGSILSGTADTLNALVAGRVVQGLGGSMMMPASLALILAAVAPARRDRAIATWGAMAGLAAALGPVVGGVLVAGFGWRAVFLLNVPLVCIAVWLARQHLSESREGDSASASDGKTWFGTVLSGLLEILNIPFSLARIASFRWVIFSTLPFVAGFTAWVVMAPTFFRDVWGYSAFAAGLALLPAPLTMALVARPASSLLVVFGYRGLIACGALLSVSGLCWWWALVQESPSYLFAFLPGALLFGAGVGMGFPMLAAAAVRDVPSARYATGAAGVTTIRQIAMGLGAALAIGMTSGQHDIASSPVLANHADLWLACAGLFVMAAVLIGGTPQGNTARANATQGGIADGTI